MQEYFTQEQEKLQVRIGVLRDLISEQTIWETPCKAYLQNLQELNMLCSKLQENIAKMHTSLNSVNKQTK